ncbi:MAG: TPM domain-containing protein [Coleofasciculus sp. D1-CHI-01]|uniref:TPM domain-containing protein n=1 Tax=Coleofasciculus sp. D1-CHI-01 TaxID=3068482 RepID=UPI0032FBB4B0
MKCFAGQIKQVIWIIPFCITVFSPLSVHALTIEEVPNPQQVNGTWVTDMAEILSEDTENKLNQIISELETENGTEIAVVTVLETSAAASPKAFTTELFNHWGIGKADEDNGVLFLISTGDRRVEIETGYGIEPILPDAQVGKIIEAQITPFFKQGNFDAGTLAGTQALVVQLGGAVNPIPANPQKQSITPESTELPTPQTNTDPIRRNPSPSVQPSNSDTSSGVNWLKLASLKPY